MGIQVTWIGTPNHTAGRGGNHVDHITLHIMAGYLAGTDATFQDASRGTSATYGIGADGTIHQYVRESDTPWSDSDWLSNQTGISIEHEGGLPHAKCTRACMDASARLCADIARRHGWKRLWHDGVRGNIYLHREIPGSTHTTCPDLAPNGLDVQYVINKANQLLGQSGGSTMAMAPHDVWEYHYGRDGDRRNMYDRVRGMLADLQTLLKRTASIPAGIWQYHYGPDKDSRNMYDRVRGILSDLQTVLKRTSSIPETVWQFRDPNDTRNINMYTKISRILDLLERIDHKLQ